MSTEIDIFREDIYIPSFLKIRTKNDGLQLFKPNKAQVMLLKTIMDLRRRGKVAKIIVLKARQMGFSTLTEGLAFHEVATRPLRNALIISHESSSSSALFNMFKTFLDELPEELQPMQQKSNAQELIFANPSQDINERRKNPGLRSSVKVATAMNTGTGRGSTIHFIHASEVGFWQNAEELVTGLFQTVPNKDSTIILESTANGISGNGSFFYNTFLQAMNKENDFIPLFYSWVIHDEYEMEIYNDSEIEELKEDIKMDKHVKKAYEEILKYGYSEEVAFKKLKWRRFALRNNCMNDIKRFNQEYPTTWEDAFVATGNSVFNVEILKEYLHNVKKPILEGIFDKGKIVDSTRPTVRIYKKPVAGEFFVMGCDVAEGLGHGDYSACTVMDMNFDVVATYRGHIDPDLFASEVIIPLANMYNEAFVACESNNHGMTTLKSLQRNEYHNLYFAKIYDKITETFTTKLGWLTSLKTKPLIIDKMISYIREKAIGINDIQLINEALSYVKDEKGHCNASAGAYDDLLMSAMICLYVLGEGHEVSADAIDTTKKKTFKKDLNDNEGTITIIN